MGLHGYLKEILHQWEWHQGHTEAGFCLLTVLNWGSFPSKVNVLMTTPDSWSLKGLIPVLVALQPPPHALSGGHSSIPKPPETQFLQRNQGFPPTGNAQSISPGFFHFGGVAALLWAPYQWPCSSPVLKGEPRRLLQEASSNSFPAWSGHQSILIRTLSETFEATGIKWSHKVCGVIKSEKAETWFYSPTSLFFPAQTGPCSISLLISVGVLISQRPTSGFERQRWFIFPRVRLKMSGLSWRWH